MPHAAAGMRSRERARIARQPVRVREQRRESQPPPWPSSTHVSVHTYIGRQLFHVGLSVCATSSALLRLTSRPVSWVKSGTKTDRPTGQRQRRRRRPVGRSVSQWLRAGRFGRVHLPSATAIFLSARPAMLLGWQPGHGVVGRRVTRWMLSSRVACGGLQTAPCDARMRSSE